MPESSDEGKNSFATPVLRPLRESNFSPLSMSPGADVESMGSCPLMTS